MNESNKEPSFSLHEFRSWLSKHKSPKGDRSSRKKNKVNEGMVGLKVESRLGIGRLEEKIAEANDGMDPDVVSEVAAEFKENGGLIAEVTGLTVKVQAGEHNFLLPKIYMKSRGDN